MNIRVLLVDDHKIMRDGLISVLGAAEEIEVAAEALDGETSIVGALADSVQEVLELEPEQIEAAPRIGTKLNTEFLVGMGKHNETFIMILNIDKVFTFEDLESMQGGCSQAAA
ncbi:chemotaxis protein CheW [Geobacter sp. OR-1]|nr:chemotaxis protein CheW [Geobacter sp. OR-1]